ncbi:uncharacterized protein LOC127729456 [Mytilus californianus]|uniref:uncharacterized protein LOC127729456 n=1 Tax=Mytilus californianus TaxID=6549 RepID=UPI0022450FF2|nr:uncharacterized protein LOC127729456 [Mytilus californianus]
MASSKPVHCGPCKQDKVTTQANIWCYNCDEGLCSTCSNKHKRIKPSRDHKTTDIKTYKSLHTGSINKTECDTHSKQYNLYCPSHLMPCCDACITTRHSKCTGIKRLASVVEKTKIEKSKESVEKGILSITNFLDEMVNIKSENIRRGEQQYETIKQSMSKIRNEINKHLDNLEKKLCKEADIAWSQEKSKLTSLITEIEDETKKLKEMQNYLKTVTEHTSKLQSFLGIHQIEQKVHQCQRFVEDIEDSERVCDVDIKIKQNGEIEKILKELQSITAFGDVNVIRTEISLKRKTNVSSEAQIELQSYIDNMTMNIETKIQMKISKKISDMICLMDGRVIVVEQGAKVNLLTSDGKLEKQLPMPGSAWGVTQINQDTIAITYPWETAIKIFNMKKETATKVINLGRACFGLSCSNDSLVVGLDKNEIRIIDLEGNTLKSIQVQSKSSLNQLVYCNDRVIYRDNHGKAVYCYDGTGKQIWQYKHDLSGPRGLSTDTYGNIIVVDFAPERLIIISKNGQDSKELVKKGDIDFMPWCICFNKSNESSGFICDSYGNDITRFNLSID